MCLLTFINKNENLDYEKARMGAKQNPDGFGFAIHVGSKILYDKDMDFEKLWQRWTDVRNVHNGYALWHFRIGTHGTKDLSNCHPFEVNDNNTIVAHNGILPLTLPHKDNRSDTNIFANVVMPKLGGVEYLNDKENCLNLEKWAAGNKLIFLTTDPKANWDYFIVNMDLGHWDDGVWYSNTSYKPYVYTPYSSNYSRMYGTPYLGWDDYDYDDYGYSQYRPTKTDLSPEEQEMSALELRIAEDDEVLDYMEDLYLDTKWVDKILKFTSLDGYQPGLVECGECGTITLADPFEPSATHCGHCHACLVCGTTEVCECWSHYPYHQSLTRIESNA